MATLFETREEWLQAAAEAMRTPFTARTGLSVPTVRIGVGWPSGGMRTRVGGQTWARAASADGVNEITIRVDVHQASEVLAILGHEMIHAALDCKGGHGKTFTAAFTRMGYVGTPKSHQTGDALAEEYALLAKSLGDYPSADGLAVAAKKKKQTTRMIRVKCLDCGRKRREVRANIEEGDMQCGRISCGSTNIQIGNDEGEED